MADNTAAQQPAMQDAAGNPVLLTRDHYNTLMYLGYSRREVLEHLTGVYAADGEPHELVGQNVIIRDNMAGVFVGTLTWARHKEWTLVNARKVHYWSGAGAVEGLAAGQLGNDSRLTAASAKSIGADMAQIITCSPEAYAKLMGWPVWAP